jgi:predicted kinase
MAKNLIIVTGCPGCGKSSYASRICRAFPSLQLFSYDTMKEAFFDRYGFDSEEEKDDLNARSLLKFYETLDRAMAKGNSILIEYPFCRKHVPPLKRLISKYKYQAITVLLDGDMHEFYLRVQQRNENPDRHPGHLLKVYHAGKTPRREDIIEPMSFDDFAESCREKDYNIQLGHTIRLNVSDAAALEDDGPIRQIAMLTGMPADTLHAREIC